MFRLTTPTNLVMACHFTGIYDVNRSQTLNDDDYSLVKAWADSLAALRMNGILFHNNFSEATCAAHQNDFIQFIRVAYNFDYSPNLYRYFVCVIKQINCRKIC